MVHYLSKLKVRLKNKTKKTVFNFKTLTFMKPYNKLDSLDAKYR